MLLSIFSTQGYLLFHKPLPLRSWEGTLDATNFGPKCPQMRVSSDSSATTLDKLRMDEYCLNLNVYAPQVDPDRSRLFDRSFLKEICFFASPHSTREQGASYQWHFAIRFAIKQK